MSKIAGIFCIAALSALLISGCAGGTFWAEHATDADIRAATDFELCDGYQNYKVNPGIKTEILRRGLLTEAQWDHLVAVKLPGFDVGSPKCMAFPGGYWRQESQGTTVDGRPIEVWKYLGCEPTLFTLFGEACSYEEVTFEDNIVKSMVCHDPEDQWCKSGNQAQRAKQ
jgi:hypothetical protein